MYLLKNVDVLKSGHQIVNCTYGRAICSANGIVDLSLSSKRRRFRVETCSQETGHVRRGWPGGGRGAPHASIWHQPVPHIQAHAFKQRHVHMYVHISPLLTGRKVKTEVREAWYTIPWPCVCRLAPDLCVRIAVGEMKDVLSF